MSKGPTGPEGDAETDEDPSAADVFATIEWAITTENIEMADFQFEFGGELSRYIQLLGSSYNLTGLSEDQVQTAQSLLEEWCVDESDLMPENDSPPYYMTVEVDSSIDQHKSLFQAILEDVYQSEPAEITEITRSTTTLKEEVDYDVSEISSDPRTVRHRLQDLEIEMYDGSVCGQLQLETELDINALAIGLGLEKILYEPEAFPGLVYQPSREERATVVLFQDGTITVVDGSTESVVESTIQETLERIDSLDLLGVEVLPSDAIETNEIK